MSDLQFDEQQYTSVRGQSPPQGKGVTELIISLGIVKDKKQANLVMVGLIIILAIISWFSISSLTVNPSSNDINQLSPAELDQVRN